MNIIPNYKRKARNSPYNVRKISKTSNILSMPRYKTLKYNTETSITRTTNITLSLNQNGGFFIGPSQFNGFSMVYDVQGVTIFGNTLTSQRALLPNAAEFAALFDRIRIDKIELSFSTFSTDPSVPLGGLSEPRFYIANDSNDGTGANLAQVQQQEGCKTFTANANNQMFKWTCRPKYQRLLFFTSIASSFEPATGFVNSDTAIPHYSTKVAIDPTNVGQSGVYISVKYFLTLKNTK